MCPYSRFVDACRFEQLVVWVASSQREGNSAEFLVCDIIRAYAERQFRVIKTCFVAVNDFPWIVQPEIVFR